MGREGGVAEEMTSYCEGWGLVGGEGGGAAGMTSYSGGWGLVGGAGDVAAGMTSYSASGVVSACFTAPYAILLVMTDGSLQCIRESVDSLCRDDADMPMPPYIRKAYNRPNHTCQPCNTAFLDHPPKFSLIFCDFPGSRKCSIKPIQSLLGLRAIDRCRAHESVSGPRAH